MKTKRRIHKVLVANRGEIAVRVLRALKTLGLRSAAVYSDADRGALHARMADESAAIGPAPAAQSYLRQDAIIQAARDCGADAIHPGYGFLSENAAFAAAVEKAGLVYIGPTPGNIARLGDKLAARSVLTEAGIAPVPGSGGAVDRSRLKALVKEVGFPLLLKAAAGGGGKGIRIVRSAGDLASAFDAAASEAQASFGSSDLIAERYVERARHVEVQVLGDGRGGARVFHERDCSTQRRLQKVIEETPSPAMTPQLRERLLATAAHAVAAERYRGAGTLEFLLSEAGELYFLEMNTRIQVEHPITEVTTGVDLVAAQIEIAQGAELPAGSSDLSRVVTEPRGAAMQMRVNAEDPADDFRPSTGRITSLVWPSGPWIRVDTALEAGSEVSPYYDSLLAKIIAWGPDRPAVVARLRAALRETHVAGVVTTVPLGSAFLADAGFASGRNHCQYLMERLGDADFFPGAPPADHLPLLAAAAAAIRERQRDARPGRAPDVRPAGEGADLSPWGRIQRYRLKSAEGA